MFKVYENAQGTWEDKGDDSEDFIIQFDEKAIIVDDV